jgi:hypothetical protein
MLAIRRARRAAIVERKRRGEKGPSDVMLKLAT